MIARIPLPIQLVSPLSWDGWPFGVPIAPSYTSAHLVMAVALLQSALVEAREAVSGARPEEGLGLGFNRFLEAGLRQTDASSLLRAASSIQLSHAQLAFLRSRLGDYGLDSPKRAKVTSDEPSLSPLQLVVLKLMGTDPLPVKVLKQSLMLITPPPPPFASLSNWSPYCPRLVSMCALTFTALVGLQFGRLARR